MAADVYLFLGGLISKNHYLRILSDLASTFTSSHRWFWVHVQERYLGATTCSDSNSPSHAKTDSASTYRAKPIPRQITCFAQPTIPTIHLSTRRFVALYYVGKSGTELLQAEIGDVSTGPADIMPRIGAILCDYYRPAAGDINICRRERGSHQVQSHDRQGGSRQILIGVEGLSWQSEHHQGDLQVVS